MLQAADPQGYEVVIWNHFSVKIGQKAVRPLSRFQDKKQQTLVPSGEIDQSS